MFHFKPNEKQLEAILHSWYIAHNSGPGAYKCGGGGTGFTCLIYAIVVYEVGGRGELKFDIKRQVVHPF